MRASRLVSILLLLQTRERMTAQELADALEVSVRTVYRDVESLSAAGVPLYGEPGHDGGYRLLGGFRTRLTGLTADEADSLFLTGLPTAAADLGMATVVAAAQLKLMASLPAELRDRAGRIAERFHLDAPAWYRDGDRPLHLSAVADAVWKGRAVRMRYLRWAEPREITRTVEPYGIVDLRVLDEHFDRPSGFDLADYWRHYLQSFDARRYQDQATLRLSPRIVDQLPHLWDSAMIDAAHRTATPPDPDGWTRVTIPIESVEQALTECLKLGADAEILAPAELREHIAETLDALTRIYRRSV
jgi:predicted DNA-binding transcriptional regulator YafY